MKIIDAIKPGKQFISLEFFPPKERDEWPAFFNTVDRLKQLNPLFASVTYGAGGSTHSSSLEIVSRIQQDHGMEAMAHLTCIGADEGEVLAFLGELSKVGVSNVLALRGDPPQGATADSATSGTLKHASDLAEFIRRNHPEFGVGVAAYPETHPEAVDAVSDLEYLKYKLGNGGDFAITQLFFDNCQYFDFVRRAAEIGVTKPIIPGILPVVNLKVIKRIMSLCGATLPTELLQQLEEADIRGGAAEVQKIGIAHARSQAEGLLAGGAPGVHIYTLNRADAVLQIAGELQLK
jgi:methylenetetrahydrofolate reductase (NADPH)